MPLGKSNIRRSSNAASVRDHSHLIQIHSRSNPLSAKEMRKRTSIKNDEDEDEDDDAMDQDGPDTDSVINHDNDQQPSSSTSKRKRMASSSTSEPNAASQGVDEPDSDEEALRSKKKKLDAATDTTAHLSLSEREHARRIEEQQRLLGEKASRGATVLGASNKGNAPKKPLKTATAKGKQGEDGGNKPRCEQIF